MWDEHDVSRLDEALSQETTGKIGDLNVFAAWDQALGCELWTMRDSEHFPRLLADIYPGTPSGNPDCFVSTERFVVFRATGSDNNAAIWRTDGTPSGTTRVGVGIPDVAHRWAHGVCMIVQLPDGRRRLMTYSPESDTIIPHLTDWQERNLNVHQLATADDKLFFVADHPSFGEELWCTRYDERRGAHLVRDLTPNMLSQPVSSGARPERTDR
jgi:ELWxxDGT repeat protein